MYCMECRKYVGLTLTWDVLKFFPKMYVFPACSINFNMGCFEMTLDVAFKQMTTEINFNMGCFEILEMAHHYQTTTSINFNMGCFEISLMESQTDCVMD